MPHSHPCHFHCLNFLQQTGYLKMTFTKTQAKGERIFVNAVKTSSYTVETPAVAETRTYVL